MRILKQERRGRPRKGFKQWKTVISLMVIMATIAFIGHQSRAADIANIKVQAYQEQSQSKDERLEQLVKDNQALKEKLEASSQIKVDDRTKEIVKVYIEQYFGLAANQAERVFTCESGLSPNAVHVNAPGLGSDHGVAQLNDRTWRATFEKVEGVSFDLGSHDISHNLHFAAWIYNRNHSFNDWVCAKLI